MVKAKVYRVLGWFFLIAGIAYFLANTCQPYKFQEFVSNPTSSLLGLFANLAFNFFIWAGLLTLREADKNQNESRWSKIIKPYAIFTAVMGVILVIAIFIPNLLR